jgi:protein-L-isoaspartate O-methyltransferase
MILYCSTKDNSLSNKIIKDGDWEWWITRLFPFIVRENDVVIEIGSNIGFHTQKLSKIVGPKGTIHAFEASDHTYKYLVKNTENLSNVTLHNDLVFDWNRKMKF